MHARCLALQLLWTGLSLLDSEEMKAEIEKMKETDVLTGLGVLPWRGC